jgi:hypothetical protein
VPDVQPATPEDCFALSIEDIGVRVRTPVDAESPASAVYIDVPGLVQIARTNDG